MDIQANQLFDQAMKLPSVEREHLAARLMGSLDTTAAEAADAWRHEVQRRAAAADGDPSRAIPIEEAWPQLTGRSWQSNASNDA